MKWSFELSTFFEKTAVERGRKYLVNNRILRWKAAWNADNRIEVAGKAADTFNFVNHPKLTISGTGDRLLAASCDCGTNGVCDHCIALAIRLLEEQGTKIDVPAHDAFEAVSEASDRTDEQPLAEETQVTPQEVFEEVPEETPETVEEAETAENPEVTELTEEAAEVPEEQEIPEAPEEPGEPEESGEPRSMQILFGHQRESDEPVYWQPNDTDYVFHTNTGIIGTMGTGKTQFTKSLVTQLYLQQKNNFRGHKLGILIFDYKGDYNETKQDFCEAVDARVLKPYKLPYNPLALNRTKTFRPLLPTHTANEFKDTISKIYNLGPKQQQTLMDSIMSAYRRQGILTEDPSTWNKTAPTFQQVYQAFVDENPGRTVDSLTAAMNKLHQFQIFEDDPARAKPLSTVLSGVVVIDLSGEENDIQSLVVAITLDQFYAQMQSMGSSATDGRFRQLRNLILVDEADNFMSQGFPSLRKIMKEGREFGVGMILSTQSLTHFVSGNDDYSRYVLTWVVHNVSDLKQKDVEYVFKLQPKAPEIQSNYALIKGLKKHESVVKVSNASPISIRDKAFWQLCQEMGNEG